MAFITINEALVKYLRRPPFQAKQKFNVFTIAETDRLARHDIILLDGAYPKLTIEAYLDRAYAKRKGTLDKKLDPIGTSFTNAYQLHSDRPAVISFPDFAALYEGWDFPQYIETLQLQLDEANLYYAQWVDYLKLRKGVGVVRVIDPVTNKYVAKRCVLLPATALHDWRYQFNFFTNYWVNYCMLKHPNMEKYDSEHEGVELLQVGKIARSEVDRKFESLPFWKLAIMLRKWRTDKALAEWGQMYAELLIPEEPIQ